MNKILLLFCLTLSLPLLSQQSNTLKSFTMSPIDTTKAAETRHYTVALPSGYSSSQAAALILNLHAYYEPLSDYRNSLTMDSIAEANNVIMVYPQGDTCSWNYKPLFFLPNTGVGWNAGIIGGDFDDVAFIERVLDSVIANYKIDTTQIYCMGVSNGGFMSMKVAATLGNRFAAIANIIGFDSVPPQHNVPLLSILGTADTISRYNGTPTVFPSWASVQNDWILKNACDTTFQSDTLPDLDTLDGSWVEKRTFDSCATNGLLIEYKIWNGGHNVPFTGQCTSPAIVCNALGSINNDIDPSVEIWNFFQGRISTDLTETIQATTTSIAYPNPFTDRLVIDLKATVGNYTLNIFDLKGRKVHSLNGRQSTNKIELDLSQLHQGMYLYFISNSSNSYQGKIFKSH